ncbi:MAG TPA: pilus assembly protein TadG-related protein [Gaiellaceae bacterium]|nr:pilus assembly protein TadG-related protein [Gaiellaceae bacterium]
MSRRRPQLRDESAQSLVIVVLMLVVLLGFAALVLDVGRAYLTQRRLQASVDAAALAGADGLPMVGSATDLANDFGASGANVPQGVDDVEMTVSTKCITSAPGCAPANAIVVQEAANVPTVFGKLFGVGSFTVHAKATACSPCGTRPLDVMLVLDRTGSMCTNDAGQDDHPACTDMQNARGGLRTFLGFMDPKIDHVGFAVLPPAKTQNDVCPFTAGPYTSPNDNYVLVPLSGNYKDAQGRLDDGSPLVSAITCVQPNGTTSYANALEAAQAELVKDGRSNTQKVIVFMSDGAANTGPTSYDPSSPYRSTPCHQGITSSQAIQTAGTIVYSIGYDVGHDVCQGLSKDAKGNWKQGPEQPAITAEQALQSMATRNDYYEQPDAGKLNNLYAAVAADLLAGTSRLIDDN